MLNEIFIEDARIGMRVVPQQRTILSHNMPSTKPATHSLIWRQAQAQHQVWLYVTDIDVKGARLLCNLSPPFKSGQDVPGGDWFMEYDVLEWTD